MNKWMISAKKADFNKIAQECGITPITARLIRNRDVVGVEETNHYLHGTTEDLISPWLLPDMEKAVDVVLRAIAEEKKIRIIGDYDVDGICSSYILSTGLKALGANPTVAIPDRIVDGYGMNDRLIKEAKADGVELILTCDNGIAASSQVELARELLIDVVVTDHHEVPFEEVDGVKTYRIPDASAVVDPKRVDERIQSPYPFTEICGATVSLKLIQALYEKSTGHKLEGENGNASLWEDLLSFCALATICDVMPLTKENRIIVRFGLLSCEHTTNIGLRALLSVTGLQEVPLSTYHAGFVIGPCINATGRLDQATRALDLFLEKDPHAAIQEAGDLKDLNDSRKSMTVEGTKKASAMVIENHLENTKVLVLALSDCHESLAGIIAGKVREKFHRPTFVLTLTEEGTYKGSGRSVDGYDMFAEMTACKEYLLKFGGHKMAGGLSIEEQNIVPFTEKLNERCTMSLEDMEDVLHIDMELPLSYCSLPLVEEFSCLMPCGNGNPDPLFCTRDITICEARVLGKNANVWKVTGRTTEGKEYPFVYFGDLQKIEREMDEKYGSGTFASFSTKRGNGYKTQPISQVMMHVCYSPEKNVWNGRVSLQFQLKDIRFL